MEPERHPTDPRDTAQYQELSSAYAILERVMIALDPDRPSTLPEIFKDAAYHQGISYESRLAIEIRKAMERVSHWIPCRYEGVPQCLCDCPDCCPDCCPDSLCEQVTA